MLNKVEDEETENYLRQKLSEKGIKPAGIFHYHSSVIASWLKGMPVENGDLSEEAAAVVAALEAVQGKRSRHVSP